MIKNLTMRGGKGASLVWGYRPAVVLKSWSIRKTEDGQWSLAAVVERIDQGCARHRPLLLAIPRAGGFFEWPIVNLDLGTTHLSAKLGPLEH